MPSIFDNIPDYPVTDGGEVQAWITRARQCDKRPRELRLSLMQAVRALPKAFEYYGMRGSRSRIEKILLELLQHKERLRYYAGDVYDFQIVIR